MNVLNIRGAWLWIAVSCAIALTLLDRKNHAPPPKTASVGALAPNFMLADDKGGLYHLSELRGKRVLLNFFCACSNCRAIAPQWEKVSRTSPGTIVLGITAVNPASIKQFRQATHLTFPVLLDPDSIAADRYDSHACPRSWVIDDRGQVTYASRPGDNLQSVTRALRQHVGLPAQ